MTKESSYNIKDMKEIDNKAPSISDDFNTGGINSEGFIWIIFYYNLWSNLYINLNIN